MAKVMEEKTHGPDVKRLLRNPETLQYLSEDGWTSNPDEAQSFSDVVEAAVVCAKLHLEHVEVALRTDGSSADLFCTTLR